MLIRCIYAAMLHAAARTLGKLVVHDRLRFFPIFSPFFRRGVHGQDYVCSLDRARFRSLSFACPVSPAKLHEFVGDYTAAWQYLLLFMGWPKESQLQHGARTIF